MAVSAIEDGFRDSVLDYGGKAERRHRYRFGNEHAQADPSIDIR